MRSSRCAQSSAISSSGRNVRSLKHFSTSSSAVLRQYARLVLVQPDGALLRLAHLLALARREQGKRHRKGRLLLLAADEVGARQNVAPLVVAAQLELAAVLAEEHQKVIRLHEHIVEFEEGEPLLHAGTVALRREHLVDGEIRADLAQKVDVIEVEEPVGIVDDDGAVLALETDEARHLLLEAFDVIFDGLARHHGAHIGAAGGVADHARAAADEDDGLMAGILHVAHGDELHEVADVQAVRRGIEADIEGDALAAELFVELVLVHRLLDKAARTQRVHYIL